MAKITDMNEDEVRAMMHRAVEELIPWTRKTAPKMGQITPEGIVDSAGLLRKYLEQPVEAALKTLNELATHKAEGQLTIEGDSYVRATSYTTQSRFNQAAAMKVLQRLGASEQDIKDCYVDITFPVNRYFDK